jgi:hypothetical protein
MHQYCNGQKRARFGLVYGTSWWVMEFNLDNYCDNHNRHFNKILISFAVYFADIKRGRNHTYV